MTLQDLGSIGEFVGSIAVLITLVYLAVQIRQNTKSMDETRRLAITQSQQDWTSMFNGAMLTAAESEHIPRLMVQARDEGISTLIPEDRLRLGYFLAAMAARLDMLHLQYESGFLSEETYQSTFVNSVRNFGPMILEVNPTLDMRRPSFVEVMKRIVSERADA